MANLGYSFLFVGSLGQCSSISFSSLFSNGCGYQTHFNGDRKRFVEGVERNMAHPTHLQFAYDIIRKTVLVYAHFLVYIQFEQQ